MHNHSVSAYLLDFLSLMINTAADSRTTSDELLQNEWFTTVSLKVEGDSDYEA